MDGSEEVGAGLLEACGDGPEALEPMKEAFDLTPKSVEGLVRPTAVELAGGVHGNDWLHSALFGRVDDVVGVVAGISHQCFAGGVLNEVLGFRRVVLLPGRQGDFERLSLGGRDRVNFRRKASSRTAQTIASDPPFPPAAS